MLEVMLPKFPAALERTLRLGTVMPGARLENITNLADKEVSTLEKTIQWLYGETLMTSGKMKQILVKII
jgi:hypothetical protein